MKDFDLSKLSAEALVQLIAGASAELSRRYSEASQPLLHEPEKQNPFASPSNAEIQHVKDCLRIFQKNGFVHADDVHEYRKIADKFPGFMRRNRYPMDVRGSSIKRWMDKRS